jgi:hypothetical protein
MRRDERCRQAKEPYRLGHVFQHVEHRHRVERAFRKTSILQCPAYYPRPISEHSPGLAGQYL